MPAPRHDLAPGQEPQRRARPERRMGLRPGRRLPGGKQPARGRRDCIQFADAEPECGCARLRRAGDVRAAREEHAVPGCLSAASRLVHLRAASSTVHAKVVDRACYMTNELGAVVNYGDGSVAWGEHLTAGLTTGSRELCECLAAHGPRETNGPSAYSSSRAGISKIGKRHADLLEVFVIDVLGKKQIITRIG